MRRRRSGAHADSVGQLCVGGEKIATGQKMCASALCFWPYGNGTHRAPFSRAVQAPGGWRKLAPPQARQPLPFEMMAVAVHVLQPKGLMEAALLA